MVEQSPSPHNADSPRTDTVNVVRGKIGSLNIYEITDYELEQIETAEAGGIYFNIGLFLMSFFIATLIALLTAEFSNPVWQQIFLFSCLISLVVGTILMILWFRSLKDGRKISKKVRARSGA